MLVKKEFILQQSESMRKFLGALVFLSCLYATSYGIEAVWSKTVFYLQDPIFKDKQNPYIESYWQVDPKTVRYNTIPEKGIVARIQVAITIVTDSGKTIKDDKYIYQTTPKATPDELATLNILELKRYFVVPGKLTYKIALTDLNDTNNTLLIVDSVVVKQAPMHPHISSPELIDTFYTSDVKSPFRKQGAQYIPLCSNFYDDNRKSISFYAEIYNTARIDSQFYPLYRSVFISKKMDEMPYGKFISVDTVMDKLGSYISGTLNISNLPSGNYYLNVRIGDKNKKTLLASSLFFQRMNTTKQAEIAVAEKKNVDTAMEQITVLNLAKTFVAKYDLKQCKAILKMLLPVCDNSDARAIETLLKHPEEQYIKYFIYNHFAGINKDHPEQEWKEYSSKVKEVNKMYTSPTMPGYETSRGYMYLRYGAPTDIISVPNERGSLPYEIWQYNVLTEKTGKLLSNGLILFFKQQPTDVDYRLLHTNIQGELVNLGWRNYLYQIAGDGENSNARAEQYFTRRR